MVAGGQDVGQAGQVADFFHGAVAVREFQQVEVGVRHHHKLGLAANPAAHVDIAVGTASAGGIDAQAHAGVLLLAGAAAATGHVERHRHDVALFEGFHITAHFQHLAGDFVAQHQTGQRGGPAAHHVLVGTADVGGQHPQNHAVLCRLAQRVDEFGERDGLHLDLAVAYVYDTSVV